MSVKHTLELRAGWRWPRLHETLFWLAIKAIRLRRAVWLLNHGHRFDVYVGNHAQPAVSGPGFIARRKRGGGVEILIGEAFTSSGKPR